MTEAPFVVEWRPVVTIVTLAPEVKADQLRATLQRRELVRVAHVSDLVLRLDPASALAAELRDPLEAHAVASGGVYETFQPAPGATAALLQGRFDRDRTADWKTEFHRRRTEVQAAETEGKVRRRAPNSGGEDLSCIWSPDALSRQLLE